MTSIATLVLLLVLLGGPVAVPLIALLIAAHAV